MRRSIEERFWAKVDKTDTCWLWTANLNPKGYGRFQRGGETVVLAHRFSWELVNGPIPPRLQIDHRVTCPKNCVRPDHLRLVTHKQNEENRAGPQYNSTSGVRGVYWHKKAKKWMAQAGHNGKHVYGGIFDTIEEAEEAAVALRLRLYTHNDIDRGVAKRNTTPTRRREIVSEVRKIRPGILVSLKTHQSGNRRYQKREIEHAHITEGGVERSRWDTTRIVFDPEEAKEAGQIANRARYLITRLCADTAHGPLCPVDRRDELKEAITEARELVESFNLVATYTRVEVNVICGEVVADDLDAARALFSETERFLTEMQEGLKELDVKKVRALCVKALDVGQMLSPEANAMTAVAVNAARSACKKIVAAGEQVAIEIDQRTIDTIGLARNSFLDFGMDDSVEIESAYTPRGLDFDATDYSDNEAYQIAASREIEAS